MNAFFEIEGSECEHVTNTAGRGSTPITEERELTIQVVTALQPYFHAISTFRAQGNRN